MAARWFNAHAHLELGHLHGMIPPGLPFVEWLKHVVRLKRSLSRDLSVEACYIGLMRLRETDCGAVLDISSMDTGDHIPREEDFPERVTFRELLEFNPTKADEHLAAAARRVRAGDGIAPHAPYTITGDLLRGALAAFPDRPFVIHAAETPEEVAMIRDGAGPLLEFLRPLLPADWRAPRSSPIEWLDRCGALTPRTMLAHCNEIDDADIALIARSRASVVVCPGTHEYFGRTRFAPVAKLLAAGVEVYVGTDSLASNLDLDMAREVELAAKICPEISRDQWAAMASMDKAWHLRPADESSEPLRIQRAQSTTLAELLTDPVKFGDGFVYAKRQEATLSSLCIIFDPDDDGEEGPDLVDGLPYLILVSTVVEIVDNARLQRPEASLEQLLQAFKFYLTSDAFIDFERA